MASWTDDVTVPEREPQPPRTQPPNAASRGSAQAAASSRSETVLRHDDRDDLDDRLADSESTGRPVSSSYAETDGKW